MQEQIIEAAACVVEFVLSKPILFRKEFSKKLLEDLFSSPHYLDDFEPDILAHAKEIIPRIDSSIHHWLLEELLKKMELIAGDPSLKKFFFRGVVFGQEIIEHGNVARLDEKWHRLSQTYSLSLANICQDSTCFKAISKEAQDSLVDFLLELSGTKPSKLKIIEDLLFSKCLTDRHKERFNSRVSMLGRNELGESNLSIITCYDRIIKMLKTYTWGHQNPAVELVINYGPLEVNKLTKEQQINLGRNILQAADGRARSAINFIDNFYV